MTERRVIKKSKAPVTRERLVADLVRLGVRPGGVLFVHTSLSRMGWVVGGARTVIDALLAVVDVKGTLAMPAFSTDLSDPAAWSNPPVPTAWQDTIRAHMPPFDPMQTPTRGVGQVSEQFRNWPGVRRSHHPTDSVAAFGPAADAITRSHPLHFGLGPDGPLGRMCDLDAQMLLLGVGYDKNTSLHLAELQMPDGRRVIRRLPVAQDGQVIWEDVPDAGEDDENWFPLIGRDYEATGAVAIGSVGEAEARLMSQPTLVDFARTWLQRKLGGP